MKTNSNKKSLSNIITIVIIIFLIMLLVIVLWNVIARLIQKDQETSVLQTKIIDTNIGIVGKPVGDWVNYVNLTLHRGPEKLILENTSTTSYEINPNMFADIVSVVDLSNSMGTVEVNKCFANLSNSCCQSTNCSTVLGCSMCNKGTISNTTCYFNYFYPLCCYGKSCESNSTNCIGCGGIFSIVPTSYNTTYCKINGANVGGSCPSSGSYCNNTCEGLYSYKTRLDIAKEANRIFINSVFNQTAKHRIGFIAYATQVNLTYSHNLSNDSNSLMNKITTWKSLKDTNICSGINGSLDLLKNSPQERIKVIVLMSDGSTNYLCNGSAGNIITNFQDAKNDATAMAGVAFSRKIKIYTIGFGSGIDNSTLRAIATVANGTYSYSDISGLNDVYYQIANIIKNQTLEFFKSSQIYDHIKIVFLNGTNSYIYIIKNIPDVLETRTYTIPSGDILANHITNATRIEIYVAGYTKSGEEVISPLLDSYDL